jgi:hypothetical protein
MLRRVAAVLICPLIAWLGAACDRSAPAAPHSSTGPRAELIATPAQATDWITRALSLGELLSDDIRMTAWTDQAEVDDPDPIKVVPFEFDPFKTYLVRARWLRGTGCPTGATVNNGSMATSFTDAACMSGDPKDGKNEGLLLVKTGPTPNYASAGAEVKGVNGITLTELGYDIRTGSHCGGGAPRFNVVTTDGTLHFLACNSPPAVVDAGSPGWKRLRWTADLLTGCVPAFPAICSPVKSISIVFDEGQDTPSAGPPGPETGSGLAVLDNIDVNGKLVGQGPGN